MSSQIKQIHTNKKSVVIVAGEASGDAHAARLVNELKKLDDTISFRGMGGDSLRDAGVDIFIDMGKISVVGFVEVLLKYNLIKTELNKLKQNITKQPPDLLILVDYQEFNQRLAAFAKSIGIKVLFYIGPQVWAWRPKRVYKMGKIVDHMAVIMPFEKVLYDDANVPVTFTGHPLTDEVVKDKTTQQARELLQIENKTTIGLFPGSRGSEISNILPILLESAKLIRQQQIQNNNEVQFVLPVANTIKAEDLAPFKGILKELSVTTIQNKFYDVAQSCDVILTASGTATLEIGLLEIPMVIVYKTSAITFFIGKNLVSLKHIGLVNIIPGKEVVREFLQGDAKPTLIAKEALHLLNDKIYYRTMRHELSLIRQQLGDGNGSKNVAELAWKMLLENAK
ncbi:Lipid-A-disaccharide synthase [hydrothermal vent metagenome]|uniref:lipid-A-disaccharide synthase n=1 Tax=hydrothermal vent metagenome TaxID=652676 RepID=A0A3B0W9I0_9ZZZZ